MPTNRELDIQTDLYADYIEEDDEKIDYREILGYLFDTKWTILSIAGVVFFIAAIKAYLAVPIYQVDAMLQFEASNETVPGLATPAMPMMASSPLAEIDKIKSRRIIGEVVDELRLAYYILPHYFPAIGSTMAHRYHGSALAKPFLGLDDYAWGGEVLTLDRFDISGQLALTSTEWQVVTEGNQGYTLMYGGEEVLSSEVGKDITVDYRESKIAIQVSQLTARPGVSFTVTHSVRIDAIDAIRDRLIVGQSGIGVMNFSKNSMLTLSMHGSNPYSIVKIVNAVTAVYARNNLEGQAKEAEQKLEFIDGQLPALKAKQDEAALELQRFQREAGSVNISLEIEHTLTQLEELKNETAALKLEKEELQQKYTKEHPMLKTLSRKLEIIDKNKDDHEQTLRELPEKEWEFLQKKREVESSTELYVSLLNTAQELRVAKAGMTGNVQIIDPAVIQLSNAQLGRAKTLLIGLILGLILGIAWILLKRMMHHGVEDPISIERDTGLPVFATIPHSDDQQKLHSRVEQRDKDNSEPILLAYESDADMAIEALRSFRTNMRFALKTSENNVVIITGPAPSIGKSFFSSNYAAMSCKEGQRVLLIDADMRKGHLHKEMGTGNSHGLSEVIAGSLTLKEATHEIKEHFYFLPCGKRPPNPSELLETEEFRMLLEEANQSFDLVIVDTPPILAVTDASIVAQYGGKLFMLIRSGQHPIKEILMALSKFDKSGVKVTGILINDQEVKAAGYGYGYGYGYQYHYK